VIDASTKDCPMRSWLRNLLPLLSTLVVAAPALGTDSESRIDVSRRGGIFVVDAALWAPVAPHEAWTVLVDFDHMASFVPNLSESRVVSRSAGQVTVAQKGVARLGLLRYPFESVREVDLQPFEQVRSRNVGGNVSRIDSTTRIFESGSGTRILYHVEVAPEFWFPDLIGEAFLRHEIREQFDAIVKEMVRRQKLGPAQSGKL
jgi:hypothetical protein